MSECARRSLRATIRRSANSNGWTRTRASRCRPPSITCRCSTSPRCRERTSRCPSPWTVTRWARSACSQRLRECPRASAPPVRFRAPRRSRIMRRIPFLRDIRHASARTGSRLSPHRGAARTAVSAPQARRRARLSRRRHADRSLRLRHDRRGRVHAAVRRVRRRAAAFPRWPGAAAEPPVGAALAAVALAFGFSWQAALVAGFGLAMSSTALVLASLAERKQLATRHGREAFAVLLFQDVSVIPLLALLPLLSDSGTHAAGGWMAAVKGLAVIAVVIISSRIVVRPVLKAVASYGGREVFTAAALLLVVGAALIMEKIGLSASLGAFLDGVLLADSEFRHELEADIEPFKGLLLGLFFIAVGMSANLGLVWERPLAVLGLVFGLMLAKLALMYAIARIGGAPNDTAQRLAVSVSQGGEFAFILFVAAGSLGIFDAGTAQLLVVVVTVSMLLAPLAFEAHERGLARWTEQHATPEFDAITGPGNPVIIAGYGRVGQIISRVLRMCGVPFTALEASYQQVDFVRRFGSKVYYGDASRLELLEAAKTGETKLFVLSIDDVEASVKTAAVVRKHFPQVPVLARARNRVHLFRLRDLGVKLSWGETFPTGLAIARHALLSLGFGIAASERAVSLFRQHDEQRLEAQYAVQHDEAQLIQTSREAAAQLQELFEADGLQPLPGFPQPAAAAAPKE